MYSSVPSVKIPYHTDTHGIGRPDSKINALHPVKLHGMCPQFFINIITNACCKLLLLLYGNLLFKSVRVINFFLSAVFIHCFIFIFWNLIPRKQYREKSRLVFHLHFILWFPPAKQHLYLLRSRPKALYQNTVRRFPGSQNPLRLAFFRIYHSLNFRPIHHII